MRVIISSLLVVFACLVLAAQEAPRPAVAGPADRVEPLDRNNDGKLSAEEVAAMPTVSRLLPVADADKDGALSRDEIRAASKRWPKLASLLEGASDPTEPARLRWIPVNEMQGGAYGRPQSLAVSDGVLYAAFGYANQRSRDKEGGLYQRVGGDKPRWEKVYSWFDGRGPFEYLMRGLTTVAGNDGRPALLGALERPPLPVVRRIEPAKAFAAVDEVNYENYFANVFGAWPNVGVFMNGAALNRF